MALWDKIQSRGNVEDRRSAGPAALGGLGVVGVIVFIALNFLSGGNAGDALNQLEQVQLQQNQTYNAKDFEGKDGYEVFVSTVLGSTNDMWRKFFAQNNLTYTEPTLVLFRGQTQSACGGAYSQSGPHYCPLDKTIYLDETFFEELTTKLGAEGGDVAEAYVIAHEVGHHAQLELYGLTEDATNAESVRQELQADCFAGLWAYSIKDLSVFEPGELHEAIDAASAVGDDRIQAETTGVVNPESWTHGSSAERIAAFNSGYESGSVSRCAQ